MRAFKVWIVVGAVALTVGTGACAGGTKSSAPSGPTADTQQAVGPQSSTSSPAAALPGTTATTRPGAGPQAPNPSRLSPQDAAALVLGITGQIQQAENTPNGPRALTRAEAQAIVDAQSKALGIPVTKP